MRAVLAMIRYLALLVFLPQVAWSQYPTNLLGASLLGQPPTNVYQGGQASDAFSSLCYLGDGRIIAGKRSSTATNRFVLSADHGVTWRIVGCANSTGSHAYFFGQNGATVFSGTGDTGSACLMRSTDTGSTWSVALTTADLNGLIGGTALAVFGPVYMGSNRWAVNVKSTDTTKKIIVSSDNGSNWYAPSAQPGQSASAWARRMILTSDNVLLWPSCQTDRMYESTNQGANWSYATVPGASLFQPLLDAGNGVYLCGEVRATGQTPITLFRSTDKGLSWTNVASVNLMRSTVTYWRDILRAGSNLFASACCVENSSTERRMMLFTSGDDGQTWFSLGNPFIGPYGGMQAIYQMCLTESNAVFAACQPDSTILRWPVPTNSSAVVCVSSLIPPLELTKCGTGAFTLTGMNSFAGSLTVSEGCLRVTGSLSVSGGVRNEGEIWVSNGVLAAGGTITNDGRLVLVSGAAVGGGLVNRGTLDMMTGAQSLPVPFTNNGILLDRDDVRISGVAASGTWVNVMAPSYVEHDYWLQTNVSVGAVSWGGCGTSRGGTGGILSFTDADPGTQKFYRIVITP